LSTADDSVSFKPNTTFTTVERMWCNGSHGISVGSLGQYYGETDIVSDIYVRNITMMNAQNGARIKVFGGSNDTNSVSGGGSGYVRNVTFQDFRNESESSASTLVPITDQGVDVDNPIYLTQCYSSSAQQ
jgi:galacturan 1,4-alpha-galacturonidase